jgi:hypothetical protein
VVIILGCCKIAILRIQSLMIPGTFTESADAASSDRIFVRNAIHPGSVNRPQMRISGCLTRFIWISADSDSPG